MTRYIYKLLVFIAPLVLIILIFFFVAAKIHRFRPNSMYYSQEFESAFNDKNFDVIAIGNSKLLSAINKEILEENGRYSVVNLGYSSSNVSVSKLTLESYLNNCSVYPKLVLLEVSWFTFNNKRTHLHEIVGDLFIRDFRLWKNYFNYKSEVLFPIIKNAWKTSFKRIFGIELAMEEVSYAKWFKPSSPLSIDYRFEVKEMEVVFPEHLAGVDKILLFDFYSIIRMCRNKNIDLVLFTAPEDREYSSCQKDISLIKKVFIDVANSNSNVSYLDYTLDADLYDKKFENWLKDSHHINENTLFTRELIKDIKARTHNNVYTK